MELWNLLKTQTIRNLGVVTGTYTVATLKAKKTIREISALVSIIYRGLILHHQENRDIRTCFHPLLMSPLLNPLRNKLSHQMAMHSTVQ